MESNKPVMTHYTDGSKDQGTVLEDIEFRALPLTDNTEDFQLYL